MSKTSPTQRALKTARDLGFTAAVVERWNSHARIRQDLFGVIDLVLIRPGVGIVGVQATSGTNHSHRVVKAVAEPRLRTWLESGGRFEVWSFAKRGERGKRKLWELRRQELTVEDLPAEPPEEVPELLALTGGR